MIGFIRGTMASGALIALIAGPGEAQEGQVGTLLVAHGGGPTWDGQVHAIAEMVQTPGPVEVSFLMGSGASEHRFQDAAQRLVERGAREIVVVPLLVSSYSGHYDQIRYLVGETDEISETMLHHMHMSGIDRATVDVPIALRPALDDADEVARVLADRALDLADDPSERALFLIGHGPNDAEPNAQWMSNLRPVADRVRELTGFRNVKVGLVRDDAPAPVREEAVRAVREMIQMQHELTGQPVIVVPILIGTGSVSREKFPADLEGLPVIYRGEALLPHPEIARLVESRVSAGELRR